MKTVMTLKESNHYSGGKRINVRTIETTTALSDDLNELAGYQTALAEHQAILERLNQAEPDAMVSREEIEKEKTRIQNEMGVLKAAIRIQQEYIRGFDDGD